MTTPALEGRGIGKQFGTGELAVRALHPTDIAVARGEVLVIMGPSGSGKTTLLSILGLVLSPTEGEVLVGGRSVAGASADALAELRRDRVGLVFQQFNLLAGLTAIENVAIPLLLRGTGVRERDERARRALDLVAMGDRRSAKARLLSGGQQQRVAIARALVADAAVLLCDEPTASLDGATGRGVLDTLQRLAHAEDRAVVIVTHDERVLRIADRLIHVEDGRAQEQTRRAA
jgi:putative ABC transport system ATP-binding protein